MTERPNIIWIYCDELRTDALGCYGHKQLRLHTPHIDRLAAEGTVFTNHFCNSPVCVSSRVCVLTGLQPEETGVYNNEGAWKDFQLPRPLETFPEVFARHGYCTANFGKIHLPRQMMPESDANREVFQHHDGEGGGMAIWQHLGEERVQMIRSPSGGMNGGIFPDDEPYPPDNVVENTLQWLSRIDEPYFVRVSILQPHTPVLPPARFVKLYENQNLDLPKPMPDTASAFERRVAAVHGLQQMAREQLHAARIHYYAQVAWIDEQVGRIVDFLEARGESDRTLIVFNADHGNPIGDTGAFEKHTFTPTSHRVPLIFRCPEAIESSQVRNDISESLDLAPTLLGFAGISESGSYKGRNLFNGPAPEAIFSTIGFGESDSRMGPNGGAGPWLGGRGWPRRSCVRTGKYRLDKNMRMDGAKPAKEDEDVFLADMQNDPAELTNLSEDPQYTGVRERLTKLLDQHAAEAIEVPQSSLVRQRPVRDLPWLKD